MATRREPTPGAVVRIRSIAKAVACVVVLGLLVARNDRPGPAKGRALTNRRQKEIPDVKERPVLLFVGSFLAKAVVGGVGLLAWGSFINESVAHLDRLGLGVVAGLAVALVILQRNWKVPSGLAKASGARRWTLDVRFCLVVVPFIVFAGVLLLTLKLPVGPYIHFASNLYIFDASILPLAFVAALAARELDARLAYLDAKAGERSQAQAAPNSDH